MTDLGAPYSPGERLHRAIQLSAYAAVLAAIEQGASMDDRGQRGETPLIAACAAGNTGIAQLLLAHGADVSASDQNGMTALHMACITPRWQIVQQLLAAGANPNARDHEYQKTPLHYAAVASGDATIKALIGAGADVNACDRFGETPIYYAILHRVTPDAVNLLLTSGASVNVVNHHQKSPLHVALRYAAARPALAIISHMGLSPLEKIQGRSLLQHFAKNAEAKAIVREAQRAWRAKSLQGVIASVTKNLAGHLTAATSTLPRAQQIIL